MNLPGRDAGMAKHPAAAVDNSNVPVVLSAFEGQCINSRTRIGYRTRFGSSQRARAPTQEVLLAPKDVPGDRAPS